MLGKNCDQDKIPRLSYGRQHSWTTKKLVKEDGNGLVARFRKHDADIIKQAFDYQPPGTTKQGRLTEGNRKHWADFCGSQQMHKPERKGCMQQTPNVFLQQWRAVNTDIIIRRPHSAETPLRRSVRESIQLLTSLICLAFLVVIADERFEFCTNTKSVLRSEVSTTEI